MKLIYLLVALLLILACKQTAKDSKTKNIEQLSDILWKDTTIYCGTIKSGDIKNVIFHFKNNSNAPLLFTKVKSTCGCTVVKDTKAKPILPNGNDSIVAEFDSHKLNGAVERKIYILANTQKQFYILRIKANVE